METNILFYVLTMMKYCVWNVLYQVNSDDERSTDIFIWLFCDIYTILGKTMGSRAANVKVQKTFTHFNFSGSIIVWHGKIFLTQHENFNPHNQNMYFLNSYFPECWATQRLCVTVDFYAVIEPITSSNFNVIVFIFVVTIIRINGHDISVI